MGSTSDKIPNQASQADLASRLIFTVIRARVDVNLHLEPRDCVRQLSPPGGFLFLEMQLALAGKKEGTHRLTELANAGRLDHRSRNQIATVPDRLVNEGVDRHRWARQR